jgi:hypothetical protein
MFPTGTAPDTTILINRKQNFISIQHKRDKNPIPEEEDWGGDLYSWNWDNKNRESSACTPNQTYVYISLFTHKMERA